MVSTMEVYPGSRYWKVSSFSPGRSGWKISPPVLTFCADSYSVSVPPHILLVARKKTPVILPKVQVAGYTETRIHPWPNEVEVGWLCCCQGIVWEPIRKTSSRATRQGTFGHSRLSSLIHCGLILAFKSETGMRELIVTKKKKST